MLCAISRDLPPLTARFLEHAPPGRNFREETITDLITGAFAGLGSLGLTVDLPNEKKTGADMEWWFVNPRTGKNLRILIQAKRASKGRKWSSARFTELAHPHNRGTQCADLLAEARRMRNQTLALYAFYTPKAVVDAANLVKGRDLTGIDFASAHFVSTLIAKDMAGQTASKIAGKVRYAWPNRKLNVIRPRLFGLRDLLCFPHLPVIFRPMPTTRGPSGFRLSFDVSGATIGGMALPTPEQMLERLREFKVDPEGAADSAGQILDAPLPDYVRRMIEGRSDDGGGSQPFGRRVVVFNSGGDETFLAKISLERPVLTDGKQEE